MEKTMQKKGVRRLMGCYDNGNSRIAIFNDGTRVTIYPDDAEPDFEWALNMDVKISNYCDVGCPFCHEGSNVNGKHSDILSQPWLDTLHPYQELALGGGKVTAFPDLIPLLEKLKAMKVIANITINNQELAESPDLLTRLIKGKLVHGVGVSLNKDASVKDNSFDFSKYGENIVFHSIVGYTDIDSLIAQAERFKGEKRTFKVLLLGYKYLRRGADYASKNSILIEEWKSKLKALTEAASLVSFDCLALEQLDVKNTLSISDEDWDTFHQGEDGTCTFYIDAVEKKFARMSTVPVDGERYDILDNVDDMFKKIKKRNV